MPQPHALRLAKLHWANGEPIPLDIAVELMGLGYDVAALEATHFNS